MTKPPSTTESRLATEGGGEALVLPSTLQQEGELAVSRDGIAATNNFVGLRVVGPLDRGRAQRALDALVCRHEILRTALRKVDSEVVQVVDPAVTVTFDELDLSDLAAIAQRRELARATARLLDPPFELSRAPLLRALMVRLGASEHVLGWVVPHTIWDAGAHRLFLDDFTASLASLDLDPPQSVMQAGDFAAWQRRIRDPVAELYWRRGLHGASGRVDLAFDRSRGQGYCPAVEPVPTLNPDVGRRLTALARGASTTPGAAVTAAVGALVHALTGQSDVTIATAHANRDWTWASRILGCLYDFVPTRLTLSDDRSFREVVARIAEITRDIHRHVLPGRRLLDMLVEPCDLQLNFQYGQPPFTATLPERDVVVEEYRPTVSWKHFPSNGVWWGARVDINIVASPAGALGGDITYDADSCDATLASTLAAAVGGALTRLSIAPDEPLSSSLADRELRSAEAIPRLGRREY